MDQDWLITTDRLRLRPVTEADATLMLAVWNDPAFIRNVADRGIRSEDEATAAIREGVAPLFAEHGYGPYCIELKANEQLIGICGLFRRDNLPDADIGFAILPSFVGQGLGGEAAMSVARYAANTLGLTRLTAIVSPQNKPSIGLIKKLGMRFERPITMPGDSESIHLYSMTLQADASRNNA